VASSSPSTSRAHSTGSSGCRPPSTGAQPRSEDGTLVAHALVLDRFGNVALNVGHEQLAGSGLTLGGTLEIETGGERYLAKYAQTFADVTAGELLIYEDSYRTLAVAINRGDAASALGLRPDAEVRLRPR
jgi:S-adenosylmethionine hydrolase